MSQFAFVGVASLLLLTAHVAFAAVSPTPAFPKFTSPAVFDLENTVITGGLNETVGVTEYFLGSPQSTRLDFKETSGKTQSHLFFENSSQVYVWDSELNCSVIPQSTDIREVTWGVFVSRLVFLSADEERRVQYHNLTTLRGMDAMKFVLPSLDIVNGRFRSTVFVEYYFSASTWRMPLRTTPALLGIFVRGNATIGPRSFTYEILTSVIFTAGMVTSLDVFTVPDACRATPAPTGSGNATLSPAPEPFPMPSFPKEFTAMIETTMVEARRSFTLKHTFSESLKMSSTRMTLRYPDMLGRRVDKRILAVGTFQLAYDSEVRSLSRGQVLAVDQDLKDLLWPQDESCNRNVFDVELMKSVGDLFLASTGPPRYMGTTVVRGMPARIWQTRGPTYTVQWFFGFDNWRFFHSSSAPLIRMVIRGTGKSPFFVHHPFLLSGAAVPENAVKACRKFFDDWNPQCEFGEEFYTHVHDIVSFVPAADPDEFVISAACLSSTNSAINAIPQAANCDRGITGVSAFFLIVVVMLLSAFVGGVIVYFRMKPKPPM